MTTKEWNEAIKFLETAECGDWVMVDERRVVEVTNMCGGRFLMIDGEGEVAGITNEEWRAVYFLKTNKVLA